MTDDLSAAKYPDVADDQPALQKGSGD